MLLEAGAAVTLFLTTANNLTDEFVRGYRWVVLALAPVVGLIFALLAMLAIKKDEKLVRSLDRLR
jgi:cytochrome bd-type quinol oxidase subunit 2